MDAKQPIWNEDINIRKREPLNGDLSVEVAVIGAGITGILTAYFLQKAGKKVVVLEADRIGSGQTGKTTAKITYQHGLCYHNLIQNVGKEEARDYLTANRLAIEEYKRLIKEENIACDFRICASLLYTLEDTDLLEKEEKAAVSLGIDAKILKQTELPFTVKEALAFSGQAVFHPMKFIQALSENLTIYEDTKVEDIKENGVETYRILISPKPNEIQFSDKKSGEDKKDGKSYVTVTAKEVVMACHYPFTIYPGYYFARMHQERSYVVALTEVSGKPLQNIYYGIDKGGYSFRQSGDYLLLGGGGHRTGENRQGGRYEQLFAAAGRFYPGSQVSHYWSAQDCITLDDIPYIGQFAIGTRGVYVATGFKKWGMTHAMVAARIISDEILWKESSVGKVFRTGRFHAKVSLPKLLNEGAHSIKNLTIPHETEKRRCSHLGCFLSKNPEEGTWDCPCHGSRFTKEGEVIDGPAKKGIK